MDRRLGQLAAMEARAGDIAAHRDTAVVSFPSPAHTTTTAAAAARLPSETEEYEGGEGGDRRGDGKLLLQALARKAQRVGGGGPGEEGPPLTTKAMRDLSSLEKARVYDSALIRIR